MTGIAGGMSAAFAYDALGRRVNKRIGSQATAYQYDGLNRIAETSAGVTATLLPGALDEYFLRTDSNGQTVPLADALGSTLGLVNISGQLATTYWYDPYGSMSTAGAGTTNSTTFTGRESDGSGLLFYRARYYNPTLGRFISEDSLRFKVNTDFYTYTRGNPISFKDPLGLSTIQAGLGGTVTGPGGASATGGVGIAVDDQGGIGFYEYGGVGAGYGAGASLGLQASASNENTVDDLGGLFYNASAGGGGFGLDAFYDPNNPGKGGVGATLGAGIGASAFGGATYTGMQSTNGLPPFPLGGRGCPGNSSNPNAQPVGGGLYYNPDPGEPGNPYGAP